jgi:phospholipid/cholesterol/gamma-HCH transport system ATP-binding protein
MIELVDVHKSFINTKVLAGVNFKLSKGESLAIIGGSGTGKSVLLKCILGLIRQDSGIIKIEGIESKNQDKNTFYDKLGMLFQGGALFDSLTVWENISFRLLHGKTKITKLAAKEIAIDKLRMVGLSAQVANHHPSELSGGMLKRVSLARAISGNPKVIFFDEPTTGLDPIMAGVINQLIRKIVDEMGVTAITITHDIISTRVISDSVAMLHEGTIKWRGKTSEIDKSENPFVEQFINGRPEGPISQT